MSLRRMWLSSCLADIDHDMSLDQRLRFPIVDFRPRKMRKANPASLGLFGTLSNIGGRVSGSTSFMMSTLPFIRKTR